MEEFQSSVAVSAVRAETLQTVQSLQTRVARMQAAPLIDETNVEADGKKGKEATRRSARCNHATTIVNDRQHPNHGQI